MPKLMEAAIRFATAKLRSSNSDRRTSGSVWKRSQTMKATSRTTPAPMTSGMVMASDSI